ncbi:MAG: ABC transporter transmembrane domain-containing protein [Candidatus Gastranaerophilales bacterium]|nr:ABC transporter transmembrane domain-containing protein [Candidatus Gastranaerophilales bacterium]
MKLAKTQATTAFNYAFLSKRIFPYIRPLIPRMALAFILAIPLGLLDGATAFALKPYIDVVVNGNPMIIKGFELTRDLLANLIPWLIVAFAVVQGLLKYTNAYLTDWLSNKISNSIKIDLFQKLTSLDSKFFDENSSGIVLSRFLNDPDAASKSVIDSVKTLITCATGAMGLIAVLLYNSWKLALVGVVVLVIAFLPVAMIRKKIKQVSNDTMALTGGINTNFNETYHGNKIMTGYRLQESLNNKFHGQIQKSFALAMSLTKRVGWMSPIMYLIASIGVAIVMLFGNHLIISGEMTTGSFASFITSLLLLYKPIKDLGRTLTNLQNVFVAMSRVFELFDLTPEITNIEGAKELSGIQEGIEFKNVYFEYEENCPVLFDVSFSVKKGQTVALVGNSGGGKSTIVNLLPRFYDIKSGSIKIDGADIQSFSLYSLRGNISEVFQDNFLFSGTIKENILMGKPDATEEELQKAVCGAHLDEFLHTLENGVDTEIGERGTTLSGGQRQRVAIARAMIKDAPIIILDEATSALDNKSEAIVQKALENLMKDKTVFVIAHRLSTIKNADNILVINDGKLVEAGTHDELLKIESGHYKYLYEMQFQNTETTV